MLRIGLLALVTMLAGLPPETQAAPCEAAEHRAFDFWIGDWEVRTPDGKLAGTNRIEAGYGGCVLHERYQTASGYRGESLNIFDVGRRVWHQTWVDNTGLLLLLEGGPRDGAMVLEGTTRNAAGAEVQHRIRWTPGSDGSVRQHWQSREGEGDWKTLFDGIYRRR